MTCFDCPDNRSCTPECAPPGERWSAEYPTALEAAIAGDDAAWEALGGFGETIGETPTSAMLTHQRSGKEQGGMDPMTERGAVLRG